MTTAGNESPTAEVDRLVKRLDRERRAKAESEAIAENALRELYKKQKEVKLLQIIATAANQTFAADDAMQIALDQVCAHTGWPVGHVYLHTTEARGELVPSPLWHLDHLERFKRFREVTEQTHFKRGVGLPGRVLESGKPLWIIDVTKDSNFPRAKAAEDIGVRAAFGFPVLIGRKVAAVLEFFSEVAVEPDDALLEIMAHVGTQLGRVIERKRAEESLWDNNFRLQQALADNLHLYEDLKRKQSQLEIASKHKSQFLANMSHELRTPLNAILGYTQLILNNIYGAVPEKLTLVLGRIDISGRHLLDLINDVLDLSKIEAGQLKLNLTDYSMKDLVQNTIISMEPLASEKKLALKSVIANDLPLGKADERRIHQVLLNLVGNAIKFTDHGEVRVEVSHRDDAFRVSVVDTGLGIAVGDQERIFEEFQQADGSTTRKKGGTGLGLAIVKRIIALHGGTVGVESVFGEGSTFWFTLLTRVERQMEPA